MSPLLRFALRFLCTSWNRGLLALLVPSQTPLPLNPQASESNDGAKALAVVGPSASFA